MENRDINDTLSDQQRIYLIGKILSSKGLSGVLEAVDAIKDGFGVEIPGLERKLSEGEKINQINYKKSSGVGVQALTPFCLIGGLDYEAICNYGRSYQYTGSGQQNTQIPYSREWLY